MSLSPFLLKENILERLNLMDISDKILFNILQYHLINNESISVSGRWCTKQIIQ
jgi:hypothetical protein